MIRSTLLAATILGFSATPVFAQDFTAVQSINKLVTTVDAEGTPVSDYEPVESAAPGETVFYALDYDNGTADRAENVGLVMAVPDEVVYIENSAKAEDMPATVSFSTDNGTSFAPRGDLTVTLDGTAQPAGSEDITHVRWFFTQAVEPGAQGSVGFEAVVQ